MHTSAHPRAVHYHRLADNGYVDKSQNVADFLRRGAAYCADALHRHEPQRAAICRSSEKARQNRPYLAREPLGQQGYPRVLETKYRESARRRGYRGLNENLRARQ